MKSYTTLRNLFGTESKNSTSGNLTYGDQKINDKYRAICSMKDWPFLHRLRTALTTADTTFVPLPYDVDQVESVFVTVGTTRYNPKPAPSREFWDKLHYSVQTNDTPQYWFVFNGEIGLWPRPATSSNVISINARVRVIDLNTADDTARTITTLANGSQALTVSAGLTTQMPGFWIRPTYSTTANTGDGVWYEIGSVTNATTATLVRKYGGVGISAGTAACTIAQMPLLPEAFHTTPVKGALAEYWAMQGDAKRALIYERQFKAEVDDLVRSWSYPNTNMVLDDGDDLPLINPNLTISL